MSAPTDERPVFLVGFMGSGKSAVGAAIAERWGWRCIDTDRVVERRAGLAIEEIFRQSGEGRFREMEWDALRELAGQRRVVVATGGGLFLAVHAREFMRREGTSVWLDAPLHIVRERIGIEGRPLWRSEDPIALRAFFERRRATYALADLHVVAAGADLESLAERVAKTLRR